MNKSKWLVVILSILAGINQRVVAQADGLKNVVPPSPRTAEFNKFIDYKVSLENGLVENSINFHNITVDGVTIPIGISYHASGIKYGQTSGDVGLGWVLSPGYRISRTIYGQVDEVSTMPDMNNVSGGQNMQYYLTHGFSTPKARDEYLSRFIKLSPGDDIPFLVANSANYLDGQYDIFTTGLPGEENKFVITDKANKVITPLSQTPSKINYDITGGIITGFNVVDGNGVEFKLGNGIANAENLQVTVNGQLKKYNTAWLLSEVKTPLGKTITFGYEPFQENSKPMPSSSRTFVSGAWFEEMYIHHETNASLPVMCYATRNPGKQVSSGQSRLYNTSLISSITGLEEIVTISRNTNGTVSTILVKRISDNKQIKKVTFFYSSSFAGAFLDAVTIAGSDDNDVQRYTFEYESKNANLIYYDCYGYYQDDNTAYNNGNFAPKVEFGFHAVLHTTNGVGVVQCGNNFGQTYSEGIDKTLYPTTSAYTLKKITYPSGGSTSYVYESNRYKDASNTEIFGGGLRIANITSNDLIAGSGILERSYSYGDNGFGFALFNATDPEFYVREKVELVPGMAYNATMRPRVMAQKRLLHSSALQEELNDPYLQSKYGWYTKVRETYNNGYVDYSFYKDPSGSTYIADRYPTDQDYVVSGTNINIAYPSYYIPVYHFWDNIHLASKTTYARNTLPLPLYKVVQKEEYEYYPVTIQPSEELLGLKVIPLGVKSTIPDPLIAGIFIPTDDPYVETGLNSLYEYAMYKITRGDVQLKKKTITNYDMNSGAEQKEESNYEYTAYNLLSKEEKLISTGEKITSLYKYPISYSAITATDAVSAGIKKMNDLNVVNPVVEKSIFRSNANGTNSRLISSLFTHFRTDKPLADKISVIENDAPLTNFTPSVIQSGALVKDSRYVGKIAFDLYDYDGNILQQHKEGDVLRSYIWGYGRRLPIAEAINASYNEIAYTGFEGFYDGFNEKWDSPVGLELTDAIDVPTGRYCLSFHDMVGILSANVTLDPAKKYVFSCWERGTPIDEIYSNGISIISDKVIKTRGAWRLRQIVFTGVTYYLDVIGGMSGDCYLDDASIYPLDAQMTSYTHDPMIGVTGITDVKGNTARYEYDSFGRLKLIRDQDGKILKQYDYQYKAPINQ